MEHTPHEKLGYARKRAQEVNTSILTEEDNRPCIKIYNEEDLPAKRNRQAGENPLVQVQTVMPALEKFYNAVDKLEKFFRISEKPLVTNGMTNEVTALLAEEHPKVTELASEPNSDSKDILKKIIYDLDKASKLTASQIKVVESYGIPYTSTSWKFESRAPTRKDRNYDRNYDRNCDKNYDRNYNRNHEKKTKEFSRYYNPQKSGYKKLEEMSMEEILEEIPLALRPKFFPVKYSLKKINIGFSLRKSMINKRDLNNTA